MSKALLCALLVLVALSAPAAGDTVTVDCTGGGDYTSLPEAVAAAMPWDTVLVYPCTYAVSAPDWPITITEYTPAIASVAGPEATILQGDGTVNAFEIPDGSYYDAVPVRVSGLTFRELDSVIWRPDYNERGSHLEFVDNIVEGCSHGLDATHSNSTSVISNNIIRDNHSTGVRIYHYFGLIQGNEISGNDGAGIAGVCCEEPQIIGNHIHHNSGYGIASGFYCHAHDNIIEHNGGPGMNLYAGGAVDGNIIRGNQVGIYITGYAYAAVHENDIYGNVEHDVEVSPYAAARFQFDMTMNWWGTADPATISDHIWDCEDDPSLSGCIVYDPWCTEPGCQSTPVEQTTWGSIKAMYR